MKKMIKASELLAKRAAQVQRGGARAAVLGVNDGLVSVLCIVIGVAAAGADAGTVLLAGFAGALAGAISMAAGEWISVTAQVELFEGVLHDLRSIMKKDSALLESNLAENFEQHGIDTKTANHAAADVARDGKLFASMYSSQVIGINEDELGSPWVAAFSSFLLFCGRIGCATPPVDYRLAWHGGYCSCDCSDSYRRTFLSAGIPRSLAVKASYMVLLASWLSSSLQVSLLTVSATCLVLPYRSQILTKHNFSCIK